MVREIFMYICCASCIIQTASLNDAGAKLSVIKVALVFVVYRYKEQGQYDYLNALDEDPVVFTYDVVWTITDMPWTQR